VAPSSSARRRLAESFEALEHDDHRAAQVRIGAHRLQDVEARHAGHGEVQQHHVRAPLAHRLQRLAGVVHGVAPGGQPSCSR
jgi:hypothetical protein